MAPDDGRIRWVAGESLRGEEISIFISYMSQSIEEEWSLLRDLKQRTISSQDDVVIKRLLSSLSFEIRNEIRWLLYGHISSRFIRRDTDEDVQDIVNNVFSHYDWLRPRARIDNLIRNIKISIGYKKLYLFWLRLPAHMRSILRAEQKYRKKGKTESEIRRILLSNGFSDFEITQAKSYKEASFDKEFSTDNSGTLLDIIPSLQQFGTSDILAQAHIQPQEVIVNILGKERKIVCDTIEEAIRSFFDGEGEMTLHSLRQDLYVRLIHGQLMVKIDGQPVDLFLVLEEPLDHVKEILITDRAQVVNTNTEGGIDFKPDKIDNAFVAQNNGTGEIKFNIDPAMLQKLQNAPGFVPVIINIQSMTDLRLFLGVPSEVSTGKLAR